MGLEGLIEINPGLEGDWAGQARRVGRNRTRKGGGRIGRNRTRLGGGGIGKKDRAGRARRIGRNLSICPTVQYPKLLSFFR